MTDFIRQPTNTLTLTRYALPSLTLKGGAPAPHPNVGMLHKCWCIALELSLITVPQHHIMRDLAEDARIGLGLRYP